MVQRMPENSIDPSGNTEAFRAFTERTAPEPPPASRLPMIIGGVVLLLIVVAAIVWAIA